MTALAFTKHFLFSAQGPLLKLHARHDGSVVAIHKAFSSQAIHGIVIVDSTLIVWGGYFISIFNLVSTTSIPSLVLHTTLHAQDWILDIAVSPFPTPNTRHTAAVLTAHNALLLLDFDLSCLAKAELNHLTATSRCILYSANLYWVSQDHVLVASGTVFGEIILWSCHIEPENLSRSILHQLLSGHDGSIFGVRIMDPCSYDSSISRKPSLLASCSDDRTIRLWDISDLPETSLNPQAAAHLRSARETGFGVNIADALPDQATTGHCIAKAWGHASRIWNVRFLPPTKDHCIYLVTFGEDATTQYWKYIPSQGASNGQQTTTELIHLARSHVHSGKNIWSSAIAVDENGSITAATGGADGSVALHTQTTPIEPVSESIRSWDIDSFSLPSLKDTNNTDKLRGFALMGENSLAVSTSAGNIYILSPGEGMSASEAKVKFVSNVPVLRGFSVVSSLPSHSLAFLAGMDGSVLILEGSPSPRIELLKKFSSKIAALIAREIPMPGSSSLRICLMITNVESKTATVLLLVQRPRDQGEAGFRIESQWVLKLPSSFTVTSIYPITGVGESIDGFVVGSRNGAIAAFYGQVGQDESDTTPEPPSMLLEKVHGKDAVTDIVWMRKAEARSIYIYSVGRDGTFVVHWISWDKKPERITLVNRTHLPSGTILEGLRVDEKSGSIVCWGFQSKQFVVVDLVHEQELMTVDCGGANRLWKFDSVGQGGVFAWIKASQLYLSSQNRVTSMICDGGGHGREIKAIAVRPRLPDTYSTNSTIFATGSEDTNIKICSYEIDSHSQRRFRCIRTLRKHNTGIQNLQWSPDGQYLFSSGGFEEFFVWKLQPMPILGMGIVCESVCPAENSMPDLRIMNFSARQMSTEEADAARFIISMVRSDSTLRLYEYRARLGAAHWRLLSTGNYLTSCLTQCLDVSGAHSQTLITAGTDGYIAFWPLPVNSSRRENANEHVEASLLRWTSRHQIHQNAIHDIAIHWTKKDRECIMLTVGDDSSFAITRCSWTDSVTEPPTTTTMVVPRAHAAAVTGVSLLACSAQGSITFATTGLDQRLKVWRLRIDGTREGTEGWTVEKVHSEFTSVADPSSLSVMDGQEDGVASVMVCGVGIDIWRYEHDV